MGFMKEAGIFYCPLANQETTISANEANGLFICSAGCQVRREGGEVKLKDGVVELCGKGNKMDGRIFAVEQVKNKVV
jgi:hypothetical protein